MQKAILITEGSDIKAKMVYAGDISSNTMDAFKLTLETQHPACTVTIYESDENEEFVNAVVNAPFSI